MWSPRVFSCMPKTLWKMQAVQKWGAGGFKRVEWPSLTRPCVCRHVTIWKGSHRLVVPFMDCRLWSGATFSNAGQIVASVHTFTPPHTPLPCWDHLGLHVLLDPLLNSSPPLSPRPHRTGWCHRVPVTLHLPCSRLFWAGSQPPLCTATLLPRALPSARPAKQELWVGKRISVRHGGSLEPTEAGQGHSASLSRHRFLQQAGRQRGGW